MCLINTSVIFPQASFIYLSMNTLKQPGDIKHHYLTLCSMLNYLVNFSLILMHVIQSAYTILIIFSKQLLLTFILNISLFKTTIFISVYIFSKSKGTHKFSHIETFFNDLLKIKMPYCSSQIYLVVISCILQIRSLQPSSQAHLTQ